MKREDVRLRELLARATPGEWRVLQAHNAITQWPMVVAESGGRLSPVAEPFGDKEANAALIAEAINALPALLALADAVEGLTNDLHLMNEQGETPDGDGITVNVQLWAERWLGRLVAAPEVRHNVWRINCNGGDPCDDPSGFCTGRCRREAAPDGE